MNNLHFFMFSSGEYSDYCVGGMYVCDHVVTTSEWEQFAEDKLAQRQKARSDSIVAYRNRNGETTDIYAGYPTGWFGSKEYEGWLAYCEDNNSQDLFIKAHNMKRVEYTELWEY
jgi:hypothetical protein